MLQYDFSGQCLVVTGGGGLIAGECARLILAGGGHAHLVDVDAGALERARERLADLPGTLSCFTSALDSAAACSEALEAAGRPVQGLAHLAGLFQSDPFQSNQETVWELAIEVNLRSAYRMAAALQNFPADGQTRYLVFASSLAAESGGPAHVAYACAKAGIQGLVRSLARRLAPQCIVNAVAPGIIESPMAAELIARIGNKGCRDSCLRRYGQADEIARVICFLLGDGASYMTGQVLAVDGGSVLK